MPSASFIAAKVSWSVLKAPLETRGGVFAASEAKFGAAGEDVLDVGEHAGATYVSNRTFHLSLASSPDLFANVSKELGTLVVVWGYETISGSYTLLVVRNGELIRYFSRITAEKVEGPVCRRARGPHNRALRLEEDPRAFHAHPRDRRRDRCPAAPQAREEDLTSRRRGRGPVPLACAAEDPATLAS